MIAEKGSFRAAVSAAIFAFGISAGAIFCPVTAFGLQADSWALLLVCIAASIAFAVLFRVFRPVYSFGAVLLAALAFAWFCHDAFLESALGLLGGIFENYVAAFHFSMPQALAEAAGADATTALGVLRRLQMSGARLVVPELAGSGLLEPLGGTFSGLQLRHCSVPS